ncbi:MAG: sugar phosphate isomerase/epimerase [Mesorhizobium sp.]|uniref:sugar phosphate isomerase/epimerase family protein n=1 Tax=Mesorhizobium sp. TaxID=1871066 RepID=UPI00120B2C97|nr:TIM barrel protein [Mesorhizobium sp.]TIS56363.1 MAG: sugar phosphate isomerase/epimerase [Mesorhizobium sp.]
MTRFEAALCTVTFRSLRSAEIIALAREAGLAAIEWAGDAHVPPGNLENAAGVGRMSLEAGLAISYGSYIAPPTDDLKAFEQALETAETSGAANIRIWPGTRYRNSSDYTAEEVRSAAYLIRDMGAEAAKRKIAVSLEYHPNSLTDATDAALRLIETIAHDNVYLYWQPRPGLPLDEALAEIGRIGHHVSHIHVFAWDRDGNRFALSSAEEYWRAVIDALPVSRWKGRRFAMLEFVAGDDPDAFRADAATLKAVLGGD